MLIMGYQRAAFSKIFLSVILLVILGINLTIQQDQTCFLPDGKRTSTCIRLHYCNQFQQLIRQHNGRPPMDVVQNINAHVCASGGFVCCPDNAVTAGTTTTTTTTTTPRPAVVAPPTTPSDGLPPRTNLQSVRSHTNFHLINEDTCGISNTMRIVGGVDADLNEIPWAVLLGYELLDSLRWQCGGSLISKKYVLTAAHCLTRELKMARLGEYQISTAKDCDDYGSCADPVQDIRIERSIKHPNYRSSTRKNDIALLRLSAAADTTKINVKTVCMPTDEDSDLEKVKALNRKLSIFGWGKIGDGEKTADILQKALLPFVDNQDCTSRYATYNIPIYQTYLCAGGHNKTDSCKGDSGGGITALTHLNKQPRVVLYGVVSFGTECTAKDVIFPGIYTNIGYYLDWIMDNMSP